KAITVESDFAPTRAKCSPTRNRKIFIANIVILYDFMVDFMSTINNTHIVLETLENEGAKQSATSKPVKRTRPRTSIVRLSYLWDKVSDGGEDTKCRSKKSTKNPGHSNSLTEEHKAHILNLIDDNTQVIADFFLEDSSLTKSAFYGYMNEAAIILKD
ncbi:hypothetical protein A0J61_06545, partial [Choanephora cucurbitarum]